MMHINNEVILFSSLLAAYSVLFKLFTIKRRHVKYKYRRQYK